MHFFHGAVICVLAAMATASDIAFTIYTMGSNAEFYDMPINAVDGGFWINRQPKQICPKLAKGHCRVDTHTVLHGTTDKEMSIALGSMVPGGQDIYLTTDGVLGYAAAHTNKIPDGATRNPKGFTYESPKGKYADLGSLTYTGGRFAVCESSGSMSQTYQLHILAGKLGSDCVAVEVRTRLYTQPEQVWEYA